jgi:hypothetical protein
MNNIPVIADFPGLARWRQGIQEGVVSVATPKIPWNFQVSSQQGGNLLSWQAVDSADGYIVEISTTADFSTGTSIKQLPGNQNINYFDTVPTANGVAPGQRWYRVCATAGTVNRPQSVEGLFSGIVASTAIAPNDTVTAPSTARDTTTNDKLQVGTSTGKYLPVLKDTF